VSEDDRRTVDERAASARDRPAAEPAAAAVPDTGRYRRGQEIARGGMGRVVEAEDALLGRTVALKETLEIDEDARRRFEREVRITARLEHPSIVPVYDAGRSPGGLPFYVMRRLTGRPLDLVIRGAPTLDERLTYVPNVLAVLDAVGHAHRRGIVHRDLKPANVLVGELGETVVIDWGLAKVIGDAELATGGALSALGDAIPDATIAGTVVGTPGFMPPEQAVGHEVDARSDVFALGATLYHLLAGHPPYAGASATAILDRTVAEPPRPLASLVPGVPPDLVTIVGKAMAPSPADRYDDAAAMGEDLRRFLAGRLVAAHHYSPRERLVRYVRRHRRILAVIGLAIAALAVLGALSLRRIIADRDRIATARAAAEAGRTDAEATARELRRFADGLLIDQARSYLQKDPTMAIAVLKQLPADSPQWPAARAVIAEARTRGIAYGLSGHAGRVLVLEIGPDQRRVLSFGGDGVALVHDLEARTTVQIDKVPVAAAFRYGWAGPLVARLGGDPDDSLDLLDPGTGRVERRLATAVVGMAASHDGTLVWIERDGSVHRLAPGGVPAAIGMAKDATWIRISPQAGWIATMTDADELRLLRRDGTGDRWVDVPAPVTGKDFTIDFAFDDTRLASVGIKQVVEWNLTGGTPRELRRLEIPGLTFGGYAGTSLYTSRIEPGVVSFYDHPADTRANRLVVMKGFLMTGPPAAVNPGMIVLTGGTPGERVVLTSRSGPTYFRTTDPIERVTARPDCRWLVGAGGNRLLVWDMHEATPRGLPFEVSPLMIKVVGRHHVAFSDVMQTTVMDIRTHTAAFGRAPIAGTHGYVTVAYDDVVLRLGEHGFDVIHVDDWSTHPVVTEYEAVVSRGRDTVVVGDKLGVITEITVATGARHEVGRLGTLVEPYASKAGRWVVMYGGSKIWRGDGTTTETVDAGDTVISAGIDDRGTVYAAVGLDIVRWPPGTSAPVVVMRPPLQLKSLVAPASGFVLALSSDNAIWRLDLDAGTVSQIMPAVQTLPEIDLEGRCAVAIRDGSVVIADLADRTWWTLGAGNFNRATPGPTCDVIFAVDNRHELQVWDIALSRDPGELHRWLDARTNARASESQDVIEWVLPSP
jgi:hypothetical protein